MDHGVSFCVVENPPPLLPWMTTPSPLYHHRHRQCHPLPLLGLGRSRHLAAHHLRGVGVVNNGNVAINPKGLCTGNKKQQCPNQGDYCWSNSTRMGATCNDPGGRRQWVPSGTPGCLCLARPRAPQHAPHPGDSREHGVRTNPKGHRGTYGIDPLGAV